jgi:phosphoribosylglycinamide formyltransferase-1
LEETLTIYTDGGSRGNPGPGASAFVIYDKNNKPIAQSAVYLTNTTNNIAEYSAMLNGLKAAAKLGAKNVHAFSDSELMVKQINGQYRVKSDNLKGIYSQCMEVLGGFAKWSMTHVRREKNKLADELANKAMDKKGDINIDSEKPKGRKLRLAVLLSGGGRTMLNIQDEIDAGRLNAEIVAVISSRSTVKGVERAEKLGARPVIIRKKDYPDIERFSNMIADQLRKSKADLVIQAGWLCLWHIPAGYENRVMNIHPALLPSFGGQGMWGHHVHEAVIKAGCKISGCTVHFCTNEYDKGNIIVQRACEVKDDDDADSLASRVFEQECLAYPEAIRKFSETKK